MPVLDLKPGASAAALVQALRQAERDAQNAYSTVNQSDGSAWLNSYLQWAENTHRSLGNFLAPETTDDLVHTSNYWALRAATDATPRVIPTIIDELQRQQRTLTKWADDLEAERKRWDEPAALVVPDTNIFLRKERPFEAIDWHAAIKTTIDIRLVLPIAVIHELDRLKRQGNNTTQQAGRQTLRWMSANLPMHSTKRSAPFTPTHPHTTIEVVVDDGPSRPQDADGVIVRFARRLKSVANVPSFLATYDLGMRLRASAQGVRTVQLEDD